MNTNKENENKPCTIQNVRRSIELINDKNTLNDWLGRNTKRNSFLTWKYKNKIYELDGIREIWQKEMDLYYA